MKQQQQSHEQQAISFWQHLRLVPLFATILGGILLLFALCIGLASYFLIQSNQSLNDVTEEIQIRTALSNSSNHLRTARLTVIHAGASARIGEMDEFKANLATTDKRIKMARDSFNVYLNRPVKTPAGEALDVDLKKRFEAYITQGLVPMVKSASDGSFEGVIAQETDYTRKLDDAYNELLFKAIKLRTERAEG
ncbi:MAG TPA: methyl-accepting chemotaxis protein, partial [Erwinia persicina]|nr:methyl-accepting chemotaxis protein [Erwinia persicina]